LLSVYFIRDNLDLIAIFVRLYRGPVASGLASFLFALNVYVWQIKGVNHVLPLRIGLNGCILNNFPFGHRTWLNVNFQLSFPILAPFYVKCSLKNRFQ